MARSDREEQPVSEDEFEEMSERISHHFERVRNLLKEKTDSDA